MRAISKNLRLLRLFCSNNQKKIIRPEEPNMPISADESLNPSQPTIIFDLPKSDLMPRPQNTTPMPGDQSRQFANASQFQSEIISSKTFDLMDKRINPMSAIISNRQISEDLVQIDLGKLDVKATDQILLEDVNPNQIPEDLDIIFKGDKRLVLVGRKVQSEHTAQKASEMTIENKTFEEFSVQQFRQKVFGIRMNSLEFNKKEFMRSSVLAIPLVIILIPFLDTLREYTLAYKSIKEIQRAEMESLKRTKRAYLTQTLLQNPVFNRN